MRLVVDASVAVKWLVEEEHSAEAKRLITGTVRVVCSTRLLASEVANALWRKARLEEVVRGSVAGSIMEAIAEMPLRWYEDEQVSADATRLALALDRPVYDCVYLALAQRIRSRLVTADERFARALAPTEHGGTVVILTDLVTAQEEDTAEAPADVPMETGTAPPSDHDGTTRLACGGGRRRSMTRWAFPQDTLRDSPQSARSKDIEQRASIDSHTRLPVALDHDLNDRQCLNDPDKVPARRS